MAKLIFYQRDIEPLRLKKFFKISRIHKFFLAKCFASVLAYLNVSAVALLTSPVLDGFVLASKLNVLGLIECGDVVVEFAVHIFGSFNWLGTIVTVAEFELFGVV